MKKKLIWRVAGGCLFLNTHGIPWVRPTVQSAVPIRPTRAGCAGPLRSIPPFACALATVVTGGRTCHVDSAFGTVKQETFQRSFVSFDHRL